MALFGDLTFKIFTLSLGILALTLDTEADYEFSHLIIIFGIIEEIMWWINNNLPRQFHSFNEWRFFCRLRLSLIWSCLFIHVVITSIYNINPRFNTRFKLVVINFCHFLAISIMVIYFISSVLTYYGYIVRVLILPINA